MRARPLLVVVCILALLASALAGVWLGRSRRAAALRAPVALDGTVEGETVDVRAAAGGRVRLIAVRAGEKVKAGQLVAWLEAPEVREAALQAEQQVRDLQEHLAALRGGRPRPAVERYRLAQEEATAARRALKEAEDLIRDAPVLIQQVETAHAAQEQAAAALAEAEAHLVEARAAAPPAPSGGGTGAAQAPARSGSGAGATAPPARGGDLVSGEDGAAAQTAPPDTGAAESAATAPATDPAVAVAEDRVHDAERRKADADRQLRSAQLRAREAERAPGRIASLTERVHVAEAALQTAGAEAEETEAAPSSGETEARDLRRQLREAQSAAVRARTGLKNALVVAPSPGVVDRLSAAEGQPITAGQSVATLRLLDRVRAITSVPAERADRIVLRQQVSVRTASGTVVKGWILEIAPAGLDPEAPRITRITIDNANAQLRPGSSVQVIVP